MSKTIEEIKGEVIESFDKQHNEKYKSWNEISRFINHNTLLELVCERYAQSQTQELQEQNAELVANIQLLLQSLDYDALGVMSELIIEDLKELLTKYNHLKSNTNG